MVPAWTLAKENSRHLSLGFAPFLPQASRSTSPSQSLIFRKSHTPKGLSLQHCEKSYSMMRRRQQGSEERHEASDTEQNWDIIPGLSALLFCQPVTTDWLTLLGSWTYLLDSISTKYNPDSLPMNPAILFLTSPLHRLQQSTFWCDSCWSTWGDQTF